MENKKKFVVVIIVFCLVILYFRLHSKYTEKKSLKPLNTIGTQKDKEVKEENNLTKKPLEQANKNKSQKLVPKEQEVTPKTIAKLEKVEEGDNLSTDDITLNYRYEDDPVFDREAFSGLVKEENADVRNDLFSRKDYDLAVQQMKSGEFDPVSDLVAQFENQIDYSLGIDFPEEARKDIRSIQQEMLIKKGMIAKLRADEEISDEVFHKLSASLFKESLEKASGYLSDVEYEALYQHKKSQIGEIYQELINLPTP